MGMQVSKVHKGRIHVPSRLYNRACLVHEKGRLLNCILVRKYYINETLHYKRVIDDLASLI